MSRVDPQAKIGIGTIIEYGAVIYGNVTIGKRCYIGPHAVIGEPAEIVGLTKLIRGIVSIGDDTNIGDHVLISGPSSGFGITGIGINCNIGSGAYIGHDATIQDDVIINPRAVILGNVTIVQFCNIGAGAVIHQGIEIPQGNMIGANSFVSKTFVPTSWGVYHNHQAARLQGDNKVGLERYHKNEIKEELE